MFGVGTVLPGAQGSLEVLAEVDVGGMAHLFLAREQPTGRVLAVKAIREEHARDEVFRKMFLDEARIASRLRHPHVVRIERLDQHADGTLYLVMEFVAGMPLGGLVSKLVQRQRRLTRVTAVAIACRVAEGLHAAHELRGDDGRPLNVIHRDVSPQNVLLAADGRVKLIDFGVVKARDRLQETVGRQVKGKLRYMAPEQMRRKPLDRRADVFALGVVLWEMLTMRRLFHRMGDAEVVQRIVKGDLPPPAAFAPVHHELDEVVVRCLEKDPARRPPTAAALREELLAAVPGAAHVPDEELGALVWAVNGEALASQQRLIPDAHEALGLQPPRTPPPMALANRTEPLTWDPAPRGELAEQEQTAPDGEGAPPSIAPPEDTPLPPREVAAPEVTPPTGPAAAAAFDDESA
ncbi:MAG TPA: protein kinase, partial [Polyangiaceae bacterium LLY-WYZ-15_(1-7)]|nr:protein kinase [Polyangiaceae bacterium LLY-WYZ-15_(1-7)]